MNLCLTPAGLLAASTGCARSRRRAGGPGWQPSSTRLARDAAAATKQCKDAEQAAAGLVGQRNELRGLLDAYRAKAGGLGAAENAELDQRYQQAKDLLWTAPCDLAAATAAVNGYQQAVLHLRRSGDRS